jgi:hypothetical protein
MVTGDWVSGFKLALTEAHMLEKHTHTHTLSLSLAAGLFTWDHYFYPLGVSLLGKERN